MVLKSQIGYIGVYMDAQIDWATSVGTVARGKSGKQIRKIGSLCAFACLSPTTPWETVPVGIKKTYTATTW